MGGYNRENDNLTPEEIEKQWNDFVKNNGTGETNAAVNSFMEQLKGIDFSIRRKIIYKGKMAPTGYVYIVINKKGKSHKYEGYRMIKGNQDPQIELDVALELRRQIKEKYKE